jgi:hypothetical protein
LCDERARAEVDLAAERAADDDMRVRADRNG